MCIRDRAEDDDGLQPLQSIRFEAVQRGELAQLTSAEAVDAAPLLHGDAAMAAFYICLLYTSRCV